MTPEMVGTNSNPDEQSCEHGPDANTSPEQIMAGDKAMVEDATNVTEVAEVQHSQEEESPDLPSAEHISCEEQIQSQDVAAVSASVPKNAEKVTQKRKDVISPKRTGRSPQKPISSPSSNHAKSTNVDKGGTDLERKETAEGRDEKEISVKVFPHKDTLKSLAVKARLHKDDGKDLSSKSPHMNRKESPRRVVKKSLDTEKNKEETSPIAKGKEGPDVAPNSPSLNRVIKATPPKSPYSQSPKSPSLKTISRKEIDKENPPKSPSSRSIIHKEIDKENPPKSPSLRSKDIDKENAPKSPSLKSPSSQAITQREINSPKSPSTKISAYDEAKETPPKSPSRPPKISPDKHKLPKSNLQRTSTGTAKSPSQKKESQDIDEVTDTANPAMKRAENGNGISGIHSPPAGPILLKLAKSLNKKGSSPMKVLDYASQAVKYFENNKEEKRDMELVMSLHVFAAVCCRLGRFEEAMSALEKSVSVISVDDGLDHALAIFSGYMHMGDTLVLMGRHEDSLQAYNSAYEIQKNALGEMDYRVARTCRYLAEAHLQAMQFKEAEELCNHLLKIHNEYSAPGSVEEAADRRLMALICSGKGDHETALEYLVLASMALISNGKDVDAASVQVSIGDTHVALGRYDDAVFSYQKALTVFKSAKGEDHTSVASVHISLAHLYVKTGRQREARTYCESAFKIYGKHDTKHAVDEVISGLTEVASLYEAIDEHEQALTLLKRALSILESLPGQQSVVAGIEAQMGVLYYVMGKFNEAYMSCKSALLKLRSGSKKDMSTVGILLNQMGLASVELHDIVEAAELFEEAKCILEQTCSPDHADTLDVCRNLAATYDALGRLDDAIKLTEDILRLKQDHLGPGHPDLEDDKLRLQALVKEARRPPQQK